MSFLNFFIFFPMIDDSCMGESLKKNSEKTRFRDGGEENVMPVTYRGDHLVYFQTMNHSILIVDDNETAARTTSEILKALGYEVRVVLSGFDGVRQLKPGISLALIDVSMPGIDGIDFAMRLHESQPEVRVAFTSGFTRQIPHRGPLAFQTAPFLAKPYTVPELKGFVEDIFSD